MRMLSVVKKESTEIILAAALGPAPGGVLAPGPVFVCGAKPAPENRLNTAAGQA